MTDFENVLNKINDVKVIDSSIDYDDYKPLNLSVSNESLHYENLKTADDFDKYIKKFLNKSNSKVAFGGYNERRNLYQRSSIFNDSKEEERNIHIGLDLWIDSGTTVLAALNGRIHSFKFNEGLGNYGPTIILEHEVENLKFYTLYGHLSSESIQNSKVGREFKKGEKLATLGNAAVNGDYAAHLHFQIIRNLEGNSGDYPGVCSTQNLSHYLQNCPDPNILLKIV